MKRATPIALSACLLLAMGCGTGSKRAVDTATQQLETWRSLQESFASRLEQAGGSKRWHIEPVGGIVPRIGDVFNDASPAAACNLGKPSEREYAALPSVSSSSVVDIFAGAPIPNDWTDSLRAEAGFESRRTLKVGYTDLTAHFVDDWTLRGNLADCLTVVQQIGEGQIRLVRGYITGKIKAAYGSSLDIDAGVKLLENDVATLKYAPERGFELEDKVDRVQFQIVAYVDAEALDWDALGSNFFPVRMDDPSTEATPVEAMRKASWGALFSDDSDQPKDVLKILALEHSPEAQIREHNQRMATFLQTHFSIDDGVFAAVDDDGRIQVYRLIVR